jgi:hypothetical protein
MSALCRRMLLNRADRCPLSLLVVWKPPFHSRAIFGHRFERCHRVTTSVREQPFRKPAEADTRAVQIAPAPTPSHLGAVRRCYADPLFGHPAGHDSSKSISDAPRLPSPDEGGSLSSIICPSAKAAPLEQSGEDRRNAPGGDDALMGSRAWALFSATLARARSIRSTSP